jgi:uncharacterized membrane protein YqjE
MHICKTRGISAKVECLNANKSKVTYPEMAYNHLLHVLVLAARIWRVAVVLPSPSYVLATTRETDNPREKLSK